MESRIAKMTITSPGGTAGKNAEGFRLNIPTSWARELGISKDDRTVNLTYDGKRIIIEKNHTKGVQL